MNFCCTENSDLGIIQIPIVGFWCIRIYDVLEFLHLGINDVSELPVDMEISHICKFPIYHNGIYFRIPWYLNSDIL